MSIALAGGLLGAGLAAGGLGSFLGASSSNRATNRAIETQRRDVGDLQRMQGSLFFGPEGYLDLLRATGNTAGLFWAGNPDWYRMASDPSISEGARGRFFGSRPTLEQALDDSGRRYISDLERNLAGEFDTTRDLDRLATQNEEAGRDLTAQETARIKRDSARRLTNLNRDTSARLGIMGVNSLGANQIAANTRLSGEEEDDAILNANLRGLDRFQRARSQRIGLQTGRSALTGELGRALAGERRGTALAGPQAALSLAGGFQPFTGYSSFGGQSPLGSAVGSIGSGLTTLGSLLAFANLGGGGAGAGGSALGGSGGSFGSGVSGLGSSGNYFSLFGR